MHAAQPLGLRNTRPGGECGAQPEEGQAVHGSAEACAQGAAVRHVVSPDGQCSAATVLVCAGKLPNDLGRAVPLVPGRLSAGQSLHDQRCA